MMKVFTSNDFKGHYPVGTAAVHPFTLLELERGTRMVRVLREGDY